MLLHFGNSGNAGWSSEATSVFEELAQGQILQALLVEYAEDGIPCVHLYRVQGVSVSIKFMLNKFRVHLKTNKGINVK